MKKRERFSTGELWIGIAKVKQSRRDGVLGDADQAFTNAVATAAGRASFRSKVRSALAELGLRLMRLEDAETFKARSSKYSVDPELAKIAEEVRDTGRVGFGTFHAFDAE